MIELFDMIKEPQFFKARNNRLTGFITPHSAEFTETLYNYRLFIEDIYRLKPSTGAHNTIVHIVSRRYFDKSSTKFGVDEKVAENRDFSIHQG